MAQQELELGELAPEVKQFLEQVKVDKRREEIKDRLASYNADPDSFIVIERGKGRVWSIICPGCDHFVFERTKIAVARSWASEHNETVHEGMLSIFDKTA